MVTGISESFICQENGVLKSSTDLKLFYIERSSIYCSSLSEVFKEVDLLQWQRFPVGDRRSTGYRVYSKLKKRSHSFKCFKDEELSLKSVIHEPDSASNDDIRQWN